MAMDPGAADSPRNGCDHQPIQSLLDSLAKIEGNLDCFGREQLSLLQNMQATLLGLSQSRCQSPSGNPDSADVNEENVAHASPHPAPALTASAFRSSNREPPPSGTQEMASNNLEIVANTALQSTHVSSTSRGSSRAAAHCGTQDEAKGNGRTNAFVLEALSTSISREHARGSVTGNASDGLRSSIGLPQKLSTSIPREHARGSLTGSASFDVVHKGSQLSADSVETVAGDWRKSVEMREIPHNFNISAPEVKSLLKHNRMLARSTLFIELEEALMKPSSSHRMPFLSFWLHRVGRGTLLLPGSYGQMVLDSTGVVLLLYDSIVTPFVFAWGLKIEGWIFVSSMFITVFWTLEMFFSSRLAYYADGELETRPSVIAKHYLKTRFLFDAVIVVSDYVGILMSSTAPDSGEGRDSSLIRLGKAGRLLRLLGLARLGRMSQFVDHLFGEFEIGFALYDIIKLMAFLIWFIHCISCLWFIMRTAEENSEESTLTQYSSAVLWTTTTLVSGGTFIIPQHISQRFLICACVLFGLMFLSYFVSQLSSTAMKLMMVQEERAKYMYTLDRFLHHHHLRRELASLAHLQAKAHLDHKSKAMLKMHQVPAFEFLSGHLRTSITIELCRPHLYRHQFFTMWTILDPQFVVAICGKAIDFTSVLPKWELFHAGAKGTHAYLMIRGMAIYTEGQGATLLEESVDVENGVWLCEAALWTHWVHVGQLKSLRMSEIVSLDGDLVVSLLGKSPILNLIAFEYATQFHARLCESRPRAASSNDIEVYGVEFTHLLRTSLSLHVRNVVGLATIEQITSSSKNIFYSVHARNLAAEVQMGKSILYMVSNGRTLAVERGVSIVRVRVFRGDGRFLSNIAEKNLGERRFTPNFTYPGTKQRYNEMISDAVDRVLYELRDFVGEVEFLGSETTSEAGHSSKFGIGTKYSITTYNCKVNGVEVAETSATPYDRKCTLDPLQEQLANSTAGLSRRDETLIFHAWLNEDEFNTIKDMGHRAHALVQAAVAHADMPTASDLRSMGSGEALSSGARSMSSEAARSMKTASESSVATEVVTEVATAESLTEHCL